MTITPNTKVYEIIKRYPELSYFFAEIGICGCGFPWESDYLWSLEDVAREKGINLEELLSELKKRISHIS